MKTDIKNQTNIIIHFNVPGMQKSFLLFATHINENMLGDLMT
jgi:hypothetical protein